MMVDLWMPYMLIRVLMTLTQGHSRSARQQISVACSLRQAVSIKLGTTVGHFCVTLTVSLQTFIGLVHLVVMCFMFVVVYVKCYIC